MGRFDAKYTTEQRAAIIELAQQGHGPRDISQILAAGHEQLDPFDIPLETVRTHLKRHTAQHGPITHKEPGDHIANLTKRLILLADRETSRLEQQAKQGTTDLGKLGSLAKAVETLDKLARTNKQPKKQETPTSALGNLASTLNGNEN